MKIKIDVDKCVSCGACAAACPGGIEIVSGRPEITGENTNCYQAAIDSCPINIISFE